MTNILDIEPIYISIQDLKDSTSNSAVLNLTDVEITGLIYQAQIMIDTYLGQTFFYSLGEQEFIYPLYSEDVDGNEQGYIPKEIPLATMYTVEYIASRGIDSSSTEYKVTQEKSGPREVKLEHYANDAMGLSLPASAVSLLSRLKNRFYNCRV